MWEGAQTGMGRLAGQSCFGNWNAPPPGREPAYFCLCEVGYPMARGIKGALLIREVRSHNPSQAMSTPFVGIGLT